MSHRIGPDHADVTSSWSGGFALLVLMYRVWRMARLGFSGCGPGARSLRSTPAAATGAEVAVKSEASGLESG
jgi:hypothetical protein